MFASPTVVREHYRRNADATGHSPECRRRIAPIGTDAVEHRALDPERCARCRTLTRGFDERKAAREARRREERALGIARERAA